MDRREQSLRACREFNVAAVYLFGSRADDGLRTLAGGAAAGRNPISTAGSNLTMLGSAVDSASVRAVFVWRPLANRPC